MTALLSIIILTAYCIYAGTDKSLSATYYKVSKPYLFQVALGLGGFLMMLNLLEMTAEEIAQMEAMQTVEIPAEQTSVEQQLADLQQKFYELKAQL